MSLSHTVAVVIDVPHLRCFARLFNGTGVRFWMRTPDLESHAASRGYEIMNLPPGPTDMYAVANVAVQAMHSECTLWRDLEREQKLLDTVTTAVGPSFVVTWDRSDTGERLRMSKHFLPRGIPVVDATQIETHDPFDFCTVLESAMQVHAVDSWFLTLADMVGGTSRKFCHEYSGRQGCGTPCQAKYRRRVTIISKASVSGGVPECHEKK